MNFYLYTILAVLLHSCHSGMSGRGDFRIDQDKVSEPNPCAGQALPSPQCPQEEEEEGDDETASPGSGDSTVHNTSPPPLTEFQDGMYGSITVSPLRMKRGEEAQLQMTFTAAKAIAQSNVAIDLVVNFPNPNTGFVLNNEIKVSPATAKNFFERDPSVFTSSVTNRVTAPIMTMAKGEQFTLTFTITPQQDFEFKASSSTSTRQFKNSRGKLPKIMVYSGSTPPEITYDLSPLYTSGKLEMQLSPYPHKIRKNTDSELTLNFTAVQELKRKSMGQDGRRTHDVCIGISPYATSNYEVKSVSPQRYFKGGKKPHCSIPRSCTMKIVSMPEGASFELKLTVNASKNFEIGYGGCALPLRKKPDGINPELDGKRPQIVVE